MSIKKSLSKTNTGAESGHIFVEGLAFKTGRGVSRGTANVKMSLKDKKKEGYS
ncbi:MAG: hypothetical protein WC254_03335 [Candidatus Woesearchaeota archaeon]|jgi:hypothetical protein